MNLAGNNFNDSLLPSEFGKFKSLNHLNLSYSSSSGQIPYEISQLSSLVSLDLSYNWQLIETPVWKRVVDNLTQLRELVLDYTNMSSIRPNSLMNLPSGLFSLPSLVKLSLIRNQLSGEIGEFKSNSLEYRDLSDNMLHGSIPRSISKLVNLTHLYLSSNNLSIMLESESFSKLQKLEMLDFSYNNLLVSINNNVTYTMPNLWRLNLSSCNTSVFPIFLRTATNLQSLDLSNNRIHGQVPRWLGMWGGIHYSFWIFLTTF